MTASKPFAKPRLAVFIALALLMGATRFHHFLPISDASWAIFFAGGFYLARLSRWALPALMIEAVVIDYVATQHLGVSSFCITPAYWFLVPTHAVLWYGGTWLRQRQSLDLRGAGLLAVSALVSVTLAYAISNGSFYWFGGRSASPDVAGYVESFTRYYGSFLSVTCFYIGLAAIAHVLLGLVRREPDTARDLLR